MGHTASKLTSRQNCILNAFEKAAEPMTAQEAWKIAQATTPKLGLATVYRSVRVLVDLGHLRQIEIVDETPRYETASRPHHHHFFCRSCGKLFEIRKCPPNLDALVPRGFKMEDHSIVLYGRCRNCIRA